MPYERSAGAIIFYKTGKKIEYLLIQYTGKYWDFPRGHVEKGESDKEAARREIKEETGLKNLAFIPGFERKVSWFFKKKGENKSVYKEVVFFLCQSKNKKIKLSFEHTDYIWLSYSQAIKKPSFKNMKNMLKQAQEFLNGRKSLQ